MSYQTCRIWIFYAIYAGKIMFECLKVVLILMQLTIIPLQEVMWNLLASVHFNCVCVEWKWILLFFFFLGVNNIGTCCSFGLLSCNFVFSLMKSLSYKVSSWMERGNCKHLSLLQLCVSPLFASSVVNGALQSHFNLKTRKMTS